MEGEKLAIGSFSVRIPVRFQEGRRIGLREQNSSKGRGF